MQNRAHDSNSSVYLVVLGGVLLTLLLPPLTLCICYKHRGKVCRYTQVKVVVVVLYQLTATLSVEFLHNMHVPTSVHMVYGKIYVYPCVHRVLDLDLSLF